VMYKCETQESVKYMGEENVDEGTWTNNWTKDLKNHEEQRTERIIKKPLTRYQILKGEGWRGWDIRFEGIYQRGPRFLGNHKAKEYVCKQAWDNL
jgi:hypothetical protein